MDDSQSARLRILRALKDGRRELSILRALKDGRRELIDATLTHESIYSVINLKLSAGDLDEAKVMTDTHVEFTTCLCVAAEFNTVDVVRQLVDAGADVTLTDSRGYTPLHRSCLSTIDVQQKVEFLLERDATLKTARTTCDDTPLLVATSVGNAEVLGALFQRGADVKAHGCCRATALHIACQHGHVTCIDQLAALGADVDAKVKPCNITPLHVATNQNHGDCVKALVERHGAAVNAVSAHGDTALHLAAAWGLTDIVRTLVTSPLLNINKYRTTLRRETALHLASSEGHLVCVHLLAQHGADVEARDEDENTALHLAVYDGHIDIVRALVNRYNTAVYAVNKEKSTPLHLAALKGHTYIVQLLTSYRVCDVSAKDGQGGTAADIARLQGHNDLVKHLKSKRLLVRRRQIAHKRL